MYYLCTCAFCGAAASTPMPFVAPRPPHLRLLWRCDHRTCAFCGAAYLRTCAFCGASALRLLWRLRTAPSVAPLWHLHTAPSVAPPHCAFCGTSTLRLLWRLRTTPSVAPLHCPSVAPLWRLRTAPSVAPRTAPSVAPLHFRSCSAREITLHRFAFNFTFIDQTFKTITQYFRS